jgi:hypothetical protein
MGSHPINLTLRFLLEIAALLAMGVWGWWQSEHWWRYIVAIGVPLLAAIIWGVFAVPGDRSRSGSAPVPVPGFLRLLIELSIFAFATWAIYDLNYDRLSLVTGLIILVHYILSYDRIIWLIRPEDITGKNQDRS